MAETLLVRMDFSTFALSPHFKTAVGPMAVVEGSLVAKAGKLAGAFMLGPFVSGPVMWWRGKTLEAREQAPIRVFFRNNRFRETPNVRTSSNRNPKPI